MIEVTYLTAREVADILKMNLLTIYEYIRTGQLKSLRIGRNYRIEVNDFKAFLQEHQVKNDVTQ